MPIMNRIIPNFLLFSFIEDMLNKMNSQLVNYYLKLVIMMILSFIC